MKRILVRHLSGSRANQEQVFEAEGFNEILIGRDPACAIKFDPNADDLVSRIHARIYREGEGFRVGDGTVQHPSTNGVYINGERLVGNGPLGHDDVVQLGADGPRFVFAMDPPPPESLKKTRMVELQPAGKPTRESVILPATEPAAAPPAAPAVPPPLKSGPGKETVEAMIQDASRKDRRLFLNGMAALVGAGVLGAGGWLSYRHLNPPPPPPAPVAPAAAPAAAAAEWQTEVAAAYRRSVVYIEASWHLKDTDSRKIVHHRYAAYELNGKKDRLPLYVRLPNGDVEPFLTLNDENGLNVPVGGSHTGTGFVVTETGFIMTNRHVAYAWLTSQGNSLPMPGLLVGVDPQTRKQTFQPIDRNTMPASLRNWVPARSAQLDGQSGAKRLVGENDVLDVTFAGSTARIPATLSVPSEEADVALMSVRSPNALKPVKMAPASSLEQLQSAQQVLVMGYPGVAPEIFVRQRSTDPFKRSSSIASMPEPTSTTGSIGRVINVKAQAEGVKQEDILSAYQETIQLTVNATGPGNSGGPVFDREGRAIGVFASGRRGSAGELISFAVPIKSGLKLLSATDPMVK